MIEHIHTSEFGVVCDGVADNTKALLELAKAVATKPESHWHVHVDPGGGSMDYSDNRWAWGMRRVTFHGNGVWWRNTYSGKNPTEINTRPFLHSVPFVLAVDKDGNHSGYQRSFKINSVDCGSRTVEAVDDHQIQAGNRVLISGLCCTNGGWPPNTKYNDWATVVSVSGTTITLDRPLKHSYKSKWPEFGKAYKYGNSRITLLESTAEHFELNDVLLDKGPAAIANNRSGGIQACASRVIFNRVRGNGYWWPAVTETIEFNDCEIGLNEFDKVVDRCTLNRCRLTQGLVAATTFDVLRLRDCEIYGPLNVRPNQLLAIEGGQIRTTREPWGAIRATGSSVRRIACSATVFHIDNQCRFLVNNNHPAAHPIPIAGVGANGELLLDAGHVGKLTDLEIGSRLFDFVGTLGRIMDIDFNGISYVLSGDWHPSLARTGTLYTDVVHAVSLRDHVINGKRRSDFVEIRQGT